jgi:hypothetical protein
MIAKMAHSNRAGGALPMPLSLILEMKKPTLKLKRTKLEKENEEIFSMLLILRNFHTLKATN